VAPAVVTFEVPAPVPAAATFEVSAPVEDVVVVVVVVVTVPSAAAVVVDDVATSVEAAITNGTDAPLSLASAVPSRNTRARTAMAVIRAVRRAGPPAYVGPAFMVPRCPRSCGPHGFAPLTQHASALQTLHL
jgi:hypothetical protein